MILFFNKQFRAENGLISDLAKKIKNSEPMDLRAPMQIKFNCPA